MKDKKKNQKSKDLTLVIPAKNEFESLPSVLSELKKYNLKTKVVLEKSPEDYDTLKLHANITRQSFKIDEKETAGGQYDTPKLQN